MWQVVGHEDIVALLDKSLVKQMLSHAYLFVGPPQVGKMSLAINLAQGINCLDYSPSGPCGECDQCRRIAEGHHSDVQTIDLLPNQSGSGTSVEVHIDQIREVQHYATLKPFEGRCRVFIFKEASSLSQASSNAMLKLLEEPPESVLFILLTTSRELMFPTIVSRCQSVDFKPVPLDTIEQHIRDVLGISTQEAGNLSRLSKGRIGWALEAAKDPQIVADYTTELARMGSVLGGTLEERFAYAGELASLFVRDREQVLDRLRLTVGWWRDMLVLKNGNMKFVSNIPAMESLEGCSHWISTRQVIEAIKRTWDTMACLRGNVNPRMALEVLMLSLPRNEHQYRLKTTN